MRIKMDEIVILLIISIELRVNRITKKTIKDDQPYISKEINLDIPEILNWRLTSNSMSKKLIKVRSKAKTSKPNFIILLIAFSSLFICGLYGVVSNNSYKYLLMFIILAK